MNEAITNSILKRNCFCGVNERIPEPHTGCRRGLELAFLDQYTYSTEYEKSGVRIATNSWFKYRNSYEGVINGVSPV